MNLGEIKTNIKINNGLKIIKLNKKENLVMKGLNFLLSSRLLIKIKLNSSLS